MPGHHGECRLAEVVYTCHQLQLVHHGSICDSHLNGCLPVHDTNMQTIQPFSKLTHTDLHSHTERSSYRHSNQNTM